MESSFRKRAQIVVEVARTIDQIAQAFVIRGLVYIGEQACPYDEEFDGNDMVSTHLIGYIGKEPAGTLRLRWFADFVKVEHVAVRQELRRIGVCRALSDRATDIAARKGFCLLYATAQADKLPMWAKLGFRPSNKPRFAFSDYEYVPIERRIEIAADRIDHTGPDLVLIRPEDDWNRPGILDRSAERGSPTSKVA